MSELNKTTRRDSLRAEDGHAGVQEAARSSWPNGMDRRDFVRLLGGGILITVNLGPLTLFNSRAVKQHIWNIFHNSID